MAAAMDCDATRDLAAYGQIVVFQAQEHLGGSWPAYDQQFCQQRAVDSAIPCNDLSSSIMAVTVLRSSHDTCTLHHFPDHSTEQCALFSVQESQAQLRSATSGKSVMRSPRVRPVKSGALACRRLNRAPVQQMQSRAITLTHVQPVTNQDTRRLPAQTPKDSKDKGPATRQLEPELNAYKLTH